MKFDKIVGFGDSFIWGDELLDPTLVDHPYAHPVLAENTQYRESRCFLGLVGAHYGVATENFGIAGGSLQSTIWNYLWWIQQETVPLERCLILIGLTDSNRHSFYNPAHVSYSNDKPWHRYVHSSWVHWGASSIEPEWSDMVKKHMVLTDCAELYDLNYRQTVMFFQGQSLRHAALLQFNTITPRIVMHEPSLLWPDQSLQDQLSRAPNREDLMAPMGHPNVMGHEWIASRLIPEIDRAIMS